jgi:hypothetical protein
VSAAPKMTVRQIASAAGCNHKTVRAVVDRLYPGRAQNGVRLEFSEAEAFAIAAELPKRTFIAAPSQKREGDLPKNGKPRIPAGIQLHELRMIYGPDGAARRLDFILGYPLTRTAIAGPEPAASEAEAREGFAGLEAIAGGLPAAVINKAARASAAAGAAAVRRELARFGRDAKQGRLSL